jgi:hypothetical protein
MNEMDGIERNAAGMSRRLLLDADLLGATIIAGGAANAAPLCQPGARKDFA